jgi:hypothetical protein
MGSSLDLGSPTGMTPAGPQALHINSREANFLIDPRVVAHPETLLQ